MMIWTPLTESETLFIMGDKLKAPHIRVSTDSYCFTDKQSSSTASKEGRFTFESSLQPRHAHWVINRFAHESHRENCNLKAFICVFSPSTAGGWREHFTSCVRNKHLPEVEPQHWVDITYWKNTFSVMFFYHNKSSPHSLKCTIWAVNNWYGLNPSYWYDGNKSG